ncbi:hypothetical protein OEZ86_002113 [Tetradesmus obliquus]|nr:hypothetical protein OEZ86_002113 [Tetradesmus obliquus]
MKYWLCSADGETADVLLHVIAEATVKAAAAVPLKLEIPTYVRLLEFGHEQAKDCKDAHAAIETFVKGLVAAGCADRACASSDYLAARPPSGCKALEV